MILGDRSGISNDLEEYFRFWGISHLLVVSGLHVSALFLLFRGGVGTTCMLLKLQLFSPLFARLVPELLGLAAAWGYVVLIGLPVSAVRAAIGLSIYFAVSWLAHGSTPFQRLLLAAVLVAAVWPGVAEELGYQLTFAALAGLLLGGASRAPGERWTIRSYAVVTIMPSILTGIVLFLRLQEIGLFAPIGNLIFSPLFLVLGFYGALAATLSSALLPERWELLSQPLEGVLMVLVRCLEGSAEWLLSLPFAMLAGLSAIIWGSSCFLCWCELSERFLWSGFRRHRDGNNEEALP